MTFVATKYRLRWLSGVNAVVVLLVLGCSESPAPSPEPASRSGRRATDGTAPSPVSPFTVPGSAFINGRDRQAMPPLTVMRVNVWDAVPPRQAICRVPHGATVKLLREQYVSSEERFYFLVDGGPCKGWVADSFLSAKKTPILGDKR